MTPFTTNYWYGTTSIAALYAAGGGAPATTPAQDLVDTWASGGAGSDGFAMVFEDAAGTDAPSIYVKDSGTPANDTDINLTDDFDAFNSFLTYTSPSPKIVRQSDGDLKYCAHNLAPAPSSWDTTTNSTVTSGQSDPDGGSNAFLIAHSSTSSSCFHAGVSYQSGATYRLVVEVKAGTTTGGAWLRLFAGNVAAWFDPASAYAVGTTDAGVIGTPTSTPLGSGWYRITMDVTANNAFTGAQIQTTDGGTTESTTDTVYIYKFHSFKTPADETYLPTTTAARYALPIQHDSSNNAEGLLVEPAATNLLEGSSNFSTHGWLNVNSAESAASESLPDGTTGGWTLSAQTSAGRHIIYNQTGSLSTVQYCLSFIVKQGTGRYVQVQHTDATSRYGVIFDLQLGTAGDVESSGSPTGTGSGIQSLGNGWYRCYVNKTYGSGAAYPNIAISDSATPSYDSNGNPTFTGSSETVHLFHAQLELGSVPTSPIITTGATATRAVDILGKATTSTPIDITSATSFYVKQALLTSSGNAGIASCYLDTSNRFSARYETGSSRAFAGSDGAVTGVGSISRPGTFKTAYSQNTNKLQGATDGTLGTADTSVTLSASNGTNILLYQDTTGSISGPMLFKEILWLPEEMSDSDKQSITT